MRESIDDIVWWLFEWKADIFGLELIELNLNSSIAKIIILISYLIELFSFLKEI